MNILFYNKENGQITLVTDEEMRRRHGHTARLVQSGFDAYEIGEADGVPVLVPLRQSEAKSEYRQVLVDVGFDRAPGFDNVPEMPAPGPRGGRAPE